MFFFTIQFVALKQTKYFTLSLLYIVLYMFMCVCCIIMSVLRIASYNSTGFGSLSSTLSGPSAYFQTIAKQSDIILIQEHWLLEQQLHRVVSVLPEFTGTAVSGVDEQRSVLRGRPYGGCAVLWRETLTEFIEPCNLTNISRRICGCTIKLPDYNMLLLCVYFPTDNQAGSASLTELDVMIHDIEYFIENTNCDKVLIGGDLNCDFARHTHFVERIQEFTISCNLNIVFKSFEIDYTHIHTDGVSTSKIDHFLSSASCELKNAFTLHHVDNTSRHSAIFLHISCPSFSLQPSRETPVQQESTPLPRPAWYKASGNDIVNYKDVLNAKLSHVSLPHEIRECGHLDCKDSQHYAHIDSYCSLIITALEEANYTIPKTSHKPHKYRTPGWSEYVRPSRDDALYWRRLWLTHGKPMFGTIADCMRSSRRTYHYAVRAVRRQETYLRKERFLQAMLESDRKFHTEVKKFKGVKSRVASVVNGCHTSKEIADSFAVEYKNLYNSCNLDSAFVSDFSHDILSMMSCSNISQSLNVTTADISEAISHIKHNKSDGVFNILSDNFINAPDIVSSHLAILLQTCLSHGYTPKCLLLSSLVPIPKERLGDLTTSNNYRGIALCTLCLKIFDYVLLMKHSGCLSSSQYQFAYKAKSSTTQCTWVAREVASYYKSNGSEVFACLLDCSKAFDKIRYEILFPKLLKKGVPPVVVRYLFNGYLNSQVKVRWNNVNSDEFPVSNGVRQGAVLSPFLFNIYMDELISDLINDGSGCWIGSTFYGILVYADDILLLAPSVASLQKMILTCQKFGSKNGLDFNSKKSVCINFHKPGDCKTADCEPTLLLNDIKLKWCNSIKHLGHTISCCLDFDADISVRKGQFISCVNNILSEFAFAHPAVKVKLLKVHGTSFYGSNLWNLYGCGATKLNTTWNIAIRKLYSLPYQTHTRYLDLISKTRHLNVVLKYRFISFVKSLTTTVNPLIHNLVTSYVFNHVSPTGLMLSRITREFDSTLSLTNDSDYIDTLKSLLYHKQNNLYILTDEEVSFCQIIAELTDCLHGLKHTSLLNDEYKFIINMLATS